MIEYEVETEGFDEQIRKLEGFDRIANKHMGGAAKTSIKYLERKWKEISPVRAKGGGRYRSSIAGRVKSVVGATIVAICSTNVKSAKGFPYPAALEAGDITQGPAAGGEYHYASGPRRGQPLKGRVKRVLKKAEDQINKRFKLARDKIVKELEI